MFIRLPAGEQASKVFLFKEDSFQLRSNGYIVWIEADSIVLKPYVNEYMYCTHLFGFTGEKMELGEMIADDLREPEKRSRAIAELMKHALDEEFPTILNVHTATLLRYDVSIRVTPSSIKCESGFRDSELFDKLGILKNVMDNWGERFVPEGFIGPYRFSRKKLRQLH